MGKISFSNVWPFCEFKDVTVDGQAMVYIPKIYVCNEKVGSGPYAGKYQYSIAQKDFDKSWHVHPAFMCNGKEMSGIQISKYMASNSSGKPASVKGAGAWVSITRDNAHNTCAKRNVANGTKEQTGWHMYNVYEHHLIARLMLLEYGSGDLQTLLTGSNKGGGALWHGIQDVFNSTSAAIWIDGIDSLGSGNTTWRVFNRDGSQKYVDTKLKPAGGGYPIDVFRNKGDGYDLGDIFLGSSSNATNTAGTFGDYQHLLAGLVFCSGCGADVAPGPFGLAGYSTSTAQNNIGFRLARYVE